MKLCAIEGCGKPHLANGLCGMHYMRLRTTGNTDAKVRPRVCGVGQCTIEGCGALVKSRGMCAKHWWRQHHYGTTDDRPRKRIPVEQRFWKFVRKDGPTMPHMDTPCWRWVGRLSTHGYGQIGSAARHLIASRVSFQMHCAAIPSGQCVLHRCDNPECTNPAHLFLGTKKENSQDMVRKARHAHGTAHPKAKLTEELVASIKTSDASGRALAIELGVSRSLVTAIRRGEKWTHVVMPRGV